MFTSVDKIYFIFSLLYQLPIERGLPVVLMFIVIQREVSVNSYFISDDSSIIGSLFTVRAEGFCVNSLVCI